MRTRPRSLAAALVAVALSLGALVVSPTASGAQTPNPLQRGPEPSLTSLNASRGSFATSSANVARQSNFGGGTIYYPNDTSQGTFGVVAVSPGFFSPQSVIQWAGPLLASHGFVVITIDTLSIFDFPNSRGTQLTAALNYVVNSSPAAVRQRVDPTRRAVMGHSMGGGGSLEAVRDNSSYQAAVALQPWDTFVNFGGVRVPSMIIGAQNDITAGVGSFSEPFYEQIPASSEKAYMELAGQGHLVGSGQNNPQGRMAIVWMKRYVDNDARFEQFMCPPPTGAFSGISEYRNTCPG